LIFVIPGLTRNPEDLQGVAELDAGSESGMTWWKEPIF